ncbi:MAG: hypothetical protein M3R02_19875 [Chloroflexota bacterium]|nr:hypothetical protein [Chloroflexota bacterium]
MSDNERKLTREGAAELTGSGTREVEASWHQARSDAEAAGELERGSGSGEQRSQWTEAQSLSGLQEAMANTDSDPVGEEKTSR